MTYKTLRVVWWAVVINYLSQIPYYFDLYYVPHGVGPSVSSIILLGLTLGWFLLAYHAFKKGSKAGTWWLAAFLLVQFLFYVRMVIGYSLAGHGYFGEHVDAVIVVVYTAGYLNFVAAGVGLWALRRPQR